MERANLDWQNLGFGLTPTDVNLRYWFKNGRWSEAEVTASTDVSIPMAATALHYGQALFEGLKAFETKDGRTVIFRPRENAIRMARGAKKLLMEPPPMELFLEGITEAVRRNQRFLAPYGSNASLYIRPLLVGTGARVGVRPADEYLFLIFVTPVGPYYTSGLKPIRLWIEEEVNRAAPHGVGDIKAAGNYAAGMRATARAMELGYQGVLYLDSREQRWVDECGAANFYAIKHGDRSATYVTPRSASILESITNASLQTVARDLGMAVEYRPMEAAELPSFEEAGVCDTASVITPVGAMRWGARDLTYWDGGKSAGPYTEKLYDRLTGIQTGRVEDTHGWLYPV